MSSVAAEKKVIQVALVEDDEEIRANLTHVFRRSPDFRLLGSFPDAESAMVDLPHYPVDAVLMDINLPGIDGVECVRELKAALPSVNFLMLTAYEDGDRLFESLKAGAGGYLLKRTSSTKLLQAIQELHAGGSPMTPHIARRVVQFFSQAPKPAKGNDAELDQLTPGQKKFLEELAQGYAYKEIADHLGISVHGVRNYIRKIYEKLHVHSKVEAVNKYLGR